MPLISLLGEQRHDGSEEFVVRQRRDCDLNLGPSALESSTLTTMVMVTAAYRRVYDSRHLQADCQKNRDQLRNPTLGNRVVYGLRFLLSHNTTTGRTDNGSMEHGVSGSWRGNFSRDASSCSRFCACKNSAVGASRIRRRRRVRI